MCIRDSNKIVGAATGTIELYFATIEDIRFEATSGDDVITCLLYTSDAADERSSVDLGGRRIIKKKKYRVQCGRANSRNKSTQ